MPSVLDQVVERELRKKLKDALARSRMWFWQSRNEQHDQSCARRQSVIT